MVRAAIAFGATILFPCLALAQAACGSYDELMATLQANHGEVAVMRGLGVDGKMIEVTMAEGGTFSVVITDARQGVACLVYAGEAMSLLDHPAPGEAS